MPTRGATSGELTVATDVAAAVVIDFLADSDAPREPVEQALCECVRVLREHGWPPEGALAYCKRLVEVQARAVGMERDQERHHWVSTQLVKWLLACYYPN